MMVNEILNDSQMIVLGRVMESRDSEKILGLQIGSFFS
jgi:hypothetical protein